MAISNNGVAAGGVCAYQMAIEIGEMRKSAYRNKRNGKMA